jgi:hypothetical protein
LRVTKVSPRTGDSWLKRMPLQAIDAVGLAIVDRDPVGVELGHGIGRARIERRGLALRDLLDQAVELGGRGLVEARLVDFEAEHADRLEQAQGTQASMLAVYSGCLERHRDMALAARL